ncbi:MAG: hypothetical protein HQM14_08600 [SAR324 cluster bacterium]|nr:hypothetical protein [SAR324 cluster bacterium]
MLVFGLGLTESHWKVIFQRIQKPLSQKKVKARLLSPSEIQPQSIISTCDDISKSPPALFLLTPQGFNEFTDCLFFLSQLQMRISDNQTRYGLIIENIEKDLYPFITYNPDVILVNKMQLTVSDPALLLTKSIRSFPRIRIDSSALRIEYQGLNNSLVNQSLEEIPSNRLISLNHIHTIFTEKGPQVVEEWLPSFLEQQKKDLSISHIKGVLREKQGCYLFPGIPVDRIAVMKLGDVEIHSILSFQQLSLRSVSFKRTIQQLQSYTARRPAPVSLPEPDNNSAPVSVPIRCLGKSLFVNQLVELFLSKMEVENIRFINHLPPGTQTLEDSMIWVLLSHFEDVTLQGKYVDLHEAIQDILHPLTFFVEVDELKILPGFSKETISRIELEEQRDQLMKQEKMLTQEQRLAQNKYLLLSQEEKVLKDATQIAQYLMQYLANSILWNEVSSQKTVLEVPQVLFFCEEQDQAYELNQQMTSIAKKLWINPYDYQDADQLCHLNIHGVQQYADHGMIVITSKSMKHWENLNNEIFERYQEVTKDLVVQKQVVDQSGLEIIDILKKKEDLALRWIYTSFEQLMSKQKTKILKRIRAIQAE